MIEYPIKGYKGEINQLRTKRLLMLALNPSKWHKRFYSQYYYLIQLGLVGWVIGMAYLTDEGFIELERLKKL